MDDYVSNAGFLHGAPSFCTSAGAVGAFCWVAFLVAVVVTTILLDAVNIFTLNLFIWPTWGIFFD